MYPIGNVEYMWLVIIAQFAAIILSVLSILTCLYITGRRKAEPLPEEERAILDMAVYHLRVTRHMEAKVGRHRREDEIERQRELVGAQ